MARKFFSAIWYLLCTAYLEFTRDNGPVIAGAIAFYTALALIPIALLALSISGYVLGGSTESYHALAVSMRQVFPGNTAAQVLEVLRMHNVSGRLLVNIVGFLGLLWSSINLFGLLSHILTTIWVGQPERGFFAQRLVGLLAVAAAGILFFVNMLLTSMLAALRALEYRGGPVGAWFLGSVIPFMISTSLAALTFFLLYRFLPGGRVSTRASLLAALLAVVFWLVSRALFSALVAGSSHYGQLYGPLAGAVLLLLWIYYSAYIVIFCAEVGVAAQQRYWSKGMRRAGEI